MDCGLGEIHIADKVDLYQESEKCSILSFVIISSTSGFAGFYCCADLSAIPSFGKGGTGSERSDSG